MQYASLPWKMWIMSSYHITIPMVMWYTPYTPTVSTQPLNFNSKSTFTAQ